MSLVESGVWGTDELVASGITKMLPSEVEMSLEFSSICDEE
jgi:hypothetical protein